MRIVVAGTRGFPGVQGGVEKHCEELYPRLVSLGCEVTVFTRTPYLPPGKRLSEWKGVKFVHLPCPRTKSFEAIAHTALAVLRARALRPDVLHLHSIGPALLAPLARLLGLKVVMTHHGPDYQRAKWGRAAKAVLRLGESAGVRFSSKVIAISRGIVEHVKSLHSCDAALIPNGVSPAALRSPGVAMARFGIRPGAYAFTACRFVPEKGLEDLIEAYRAIPSPDFQLVIAGDADHESDTSRRIKQLAAATPGVVLTGFQTGDALAELFSNAGLFVLPSYYEGLPIALLEALSYGLPVLVSGIPQHREVPLAEGSYYPVGDRGALAARLSEAFAKGAGLKAAAQEASRTLAKSYDWDGIAARTFALYREVSG